MATSDLRDLSDIKIRCDYEVLDADRGVLAKGTPTLKLSYAYMDKIQEIRNQYKALL